MSPRRLHAVLSDEATKASQRLVISIRQLGVCVRIKPDNEQVIPESSAGERVQHLHDGLCREAVAVSVERHKEEATAVHVSHRVDDEISGGDPRAFDIVEDGLRQIDES